MTDETKEAVAEAQRIVRNMECAKDDSHAYLLMVASYTEKEVEFARALLSSVAERDKLREENKRLREALEKVAGIGANTRYMDSEGGFWILTDEQKQIADEALISTAEVHLKQENDQLTAENERYRVDEMQWKSAWEGLTKEHDQLTADVAALVSALTLIYNGGLPDGVAGNVEDRMLAMCSIARKALADKHPGSSLLSRLRKLEDVARAAKAFMCDAHLCIGGPLEGCRTCILHEALAAFDRDEVKG